MTGGRAIGSVEFSKEMHSLKLPGLSLIFITSWNFFCWNLEFRSLIYRCSKSLFCR